MNQARRAFLGTATIFSAMGLLRLLPGCSDDPETRQPAQPTPKTPAAAGNTPTDDDEFVDAAPAPTPPVEADPENADWAAKAKDLTSKNVGGAAYTNEAPGPFAGKERSHVPVLTIQSDGVAVVVVNHVMDAGSTGAEAGAADAAADAKAAADAAPADAAARPTHYVTTIWIQDDKGRVIFMKSWLPTDPAPPFVAVRIPQGTKTLTAYEHCNLHGVWASAPA